MDNKNAGEAKAAEILTLTSEIAAESDVDKKAAL